MSQTVYVARCLDKLGPGYTALRTRTRPAHLDYIGQIAEHIALAGPIVPEGSDHAVGSIIGYKAESLEEAQSWLREDPYTRAGLWGDIEWQRLMVLAGDLAGVYAAAGD